MVGQAPDIASLRSRNFPIRLFHARVVGAGILYHWYRGADWEGMKSRTCAAGRLDRHESCVRKSPSLVTARGVTSLRSQQILLVKRLPPSAKSERKVSARRHNR